MSVGRLTDCMQEKNLAGRFSPKNTMSEADGQTDTETEREGETGGRGRVTEREARQEQKADPRAGVGAVVQRGQIQGTVREGGWPSWERARGGVEGSQPKSIWVGPWPQGSPGFTTLWHFSHLGVTSEKIFSGRGEGREGGKRLRAGVWGCSQPSLSTNTPQSLESLLGCLPCSPFLESCPPISPHPLGFQGWLQAPGCGYCLKEKTQNR